MLKRSIVVLHRWLGVALCSLFLIWFPSGIGMMYWDFPSVTASDRLSHSPALDASTIVVSPERAYAKSGATQPPAEVRLNTFDGRPVYRFRLGRTETLVFADTGERPRDASPETMRRIAAAWTGQPAGGAQAESVDEVDQWTVQGPLRALRPLWKYSWPNGEQVYVSQASGEVVQYTTRASRVGAYLGPIPHWLYFTPLRAHQARWSAVVTWSSGLGTIAAILGLIIGLWTYSPRKRYRYSGAAASFPYRGHKRWHAAFGLIFGLGAATWAFSGMLSVDPLPARTPAARSNPRLADLLREQPQLSAFAGRLPREALTQFADRSVKELEFATFAGEPVYIATLARGETRVVPMRGPPRLELDHQRIADVVRGATRASGGANVSTLDRYDMYYVDRRGDRPLPVMLAQLNDPDRTRYYIDPKTAGIVASYGDSRWVSRWLYHGLHSLDFPWLYAHRPLWDIVVIGFMMGGTSLSVTSLILAWRVIGKRLSTSAWQGAENR